MSQMGAFASDRGSGNGIFKIKNEQNKNMNNLNKKDALIRLDAIEKEQKELRQIIEAEEPTSIMDATTPEQAVQIARAYLGESDEEVQEYQKMLDAKIAPHYLAEQRIVMCVKTLNEKKPMESTTYTPYFNRHKKPGAGFYNSLCTWHHEAGWHVAVSFRLHLNKKDHAIHLGKLMAQDYYNYIIK